MGPFVPLEICEVRQLTSFMLDTSGIIGFLSLHLHRFFKALSIWFLTWARPPPRILADAPDELPLCCFPAPLPPPAFTRECCRQNFSVVCSTNTVGDCAYTISKTGDLLVLARWHAAAASTKSRA